MQMKRLVRVGLGALLTAFIGCRSQIPAPGGRERSAVPATVASVPEKDDPSLKSNVASPSTVLTPTSFSTVVSPDLPKRPISLAECIARALENGRIGDYYDGPESRQKTSVTGVRPQSSLSGATDSIRVFAHEPAITGTAIEESLSRFDTWSETNLFWNRINERSRFLSPLNSFQEITNQNKLDHVNLESSLFRRLPTGGLAGVQLSTDMEKNALGSDQNTINPADRPRFDLFFEQPLLKGSGLLLNQLFDTPPRGVHHNMPDDNRAPGILLARISQKQSQLEFERQVHELIYRVEEAYWQLQSAYWNFYSSDNGMKQAQAAWQIAKARFDAGGIGIEDLAMIEEQLHFFRNERIQALGSGQPGRPGVLEAERKLRYVTGLSAEDDHRLVPSTAIQFESYQPDLETGLAEAHTFRPEMRQIESEIEAANLRLIKAKDNLRPDLSLVGKYGVNGLGDTVGRGLEDLFHKPHHEWEAGVRLQFPLGFRAGAAETTRAQLELAQRMEFLHDQREKILFSLQRSYRDLIQNSEQYKIRQSQRIAAAKQLKARFDKFHAGGDPKAPGAAIDLLLRAQRNWVDAVREEHIALCRYRAAIAEFERQKGTILRFANVSIVDGPISPNAISGASEYLKCSQSNQDAVQSLRGEAELVELQNSPEKDPNRSSSLESGATAIGTPELLPSEPVHPGMPLRLGLVGPLSAPNAQTDETTTSGEYLRLKLVCPAAQSKE